jgi:hypothetical protein
MGTSYIQCQQGEFLIFLAEWTVFIRHVAAGHGKKNTKSET